MHRYYYCVLWQVVTLFDVGHSGLCYKVICAEGIQQTFSLRQSCIIRSLGNTYKYVRITP